MARDFEDLHDIDDLNDDELRELVRTHLAAEQGLDSDDVTVVVEDGVVVLAGRIGTESEARIAEHVVTDVLGIEQFENQLVVDPIRRAVSPEAIDDHLADEAERAGRLLGDRAVPLSPEAEHLQEDLDGRLYGTTDEQDAIAEGTAWIPPESPTPEGRDISDAR
jgi:hypothetical protein